MSRRLSARSDFAEILAIHIALKSALKSRSYSKIPEMRNMAEALCKELIRDGSIYSKQLKMIAMMQKGASIDTLGQKFRCSRRTVFRYLNEFEEAGVSLRLEDGKYHTDKTVQRALGA